LPESIGETVRADSKDKRRGNGAVAITRTADGIVWCDHSTGEGGFVPEQDRRIRTLSPAERHQNVQAARERQAKAKAAQDERHRLGTLAARTAWLAATPCTDHPYMRLKGETLPGCRVGADGWLLVPRIDVDGNLIGLQRIDATGRKRYWPGAPTAGTFYLLGRISDDGTAIVCEGAGTAATLHRETWHTRHAVAAAMDAGNLLAVCRALRARYPRADIVLAGDDDRGTTGNPGRTKAIEAASAVDGRVALPSLCRCCTCTDHNDAGACARRRGVA